MVHYTNLLLCGFCMIYVARVSSLAVMSVDLGTEWMKIGIVSPGIPMEIALNKESKRKTQAVITFRDGLRTFGEEAQTLGLRFPQNSFTYLLDLLGKSIDNPVVQLYKKRFPYLPIVDDPERGSILFKIDDELTFTVEELISQLLHKSKEFAEQASGQKIKECVLTVPGFFNQVERQALLQAAELADLKVLQLINDYSAVALNYGIFRSKDFNETATYVLFYDMGASSTTATVVSYQTVKSKEFGYVEVNPQSTVLGVGYDRTLGGLELQIRLRDYLATKFNEMKLTSNVYDNPRAMAKLFKEAGSLKNVLSANNEHYAQIENLLNDKDFRLLVTRDQFEQLNADVFARVSQPVDVALKMAGLTLDVINQIVLVGAGTRVPKVQEELQKFTKMELSKNLNTDEAATMGAVYKAADLSKGFKVKKFITKDAVLHPIQIVFERLTESGDLKQVRRTLFGLMNPYPQKKIISFNKHVNDFSFYVNYADLDHLTMDQQKTLGHLNISEIVLNGVTDVIKKNEDVNTEFKGIKAHFNMDESGLLNLINVDLIIEKSRLPDDDESTLSKLGNTISNLFKRDVDDQPSHNVTAQNVTTADTNTTQNGTNATSQAPLSSSEDDKKPKVIVIKEIINPKIKLLGLENLSQKYLDAARVKIEKLNLIDQQRVARETALNNLESFVLDTQNKLFQDEFIEAGTETEIEKIKLICAQISDWLYEDGSDATLEQYNEKLAEVQDITFSLFERVYEHKERPEALQALQDILNGSESFLASAKNLTKNKSDNEVFTDIEINNLEKLIIETKDWRDKMTAQQDKLKKSEPVILTVRLLSEKMALLDREVKYLVNKLKIWRPKVPKEKPVVEKQTNNETEQKNKTEPEIENTLEKENTIESSTAEDNKPPKEEAGEQEAHAEL